MKKFSNTYIFLYISALVLIISIVLTLVVVGLKPLREANITTEKAVQILTAAGYEHVEKSIASDLFNKVATLDCTHEDQEVYTIQCADGSDGWVVALQGKGLWGPIWGYAVLSKDKQTIKGVVFSHKSETPGLGDRITSSEFCNAFVGKHLYDIDGNFVSVRVLPKGKELQVLPDNRVDAISGATLTSKGVDDMLHDGLNMK